MKSDYALQIVDDYLLVTFKGWKKGDDSPWKESQIKIDLEEGNLTDEQINSELAFVVNNNRN